MLEKQGTDIILPQTASITLPKLGWGTILAISIFWFALNFHWSAIGIIILPSQVFKLVGPEQQGAALAFVLVPGAFVSLFANPLFGLLSDQTRGRLAVWGKRRPYILIGTLINVAAIVWMAAATDIPTLAIAYAIVQFSSNAAQAPFHALLPDIVPSEQRGLTSGVMGVLTLVGNIAGVLLAGFLINAKNPLPVYQQNLWITYSIIIVVLIVFMLITIFTVKEHTGISAQLEQRYNEAGLTQSTTKLPKWLTRSVMLTVLGTLVAGFIVWALVWLWNMFKPAGISVNNDVLQLLLMLVATFGILRLFDFRPSRDPDFAWVLATRLLMMLGIFTIQTFLQYYMRDVIKVENPEAQTTVFSIVVAATSLVSALAVGWLSDRYGRKRMIYFSGGFMAIVGLVFVVTQSLTLVLIAGAIFGLGYGAYQSVDWALVADVLPSHKDYARDMGVWNVSLSLPQVIAPVIGGPLIDAFRANGQTVLGFQVLFTMAIIYCILGTVTVRYIRGVKN